MTYFPCAEHIGACKALSVSYFLPEKCLFTVNDPEHTGNEMHFYSVSFVQMSFIRLHLFCLL